MLRPQGKSLCVLLTAGLLIAVAGYAQEVGDEVVVREATDRDLYAAGRDVEIRAPVAGDVVAAGSDVRVSGDVAEDVIAAGRAVTVSGQVGDDARLAGRTVTVSNDVAGHIVAAGAEVRIEAGSRVGDWAWLAGSRVEIAGDIGGELKALGESVELTGRVGGDVELAGEHLRVGDGAVIGGDLTWRGEREPDIADGAVITGQVVQGPPLDRDDDRGDWWKRLFITLSVIVAAGVLYTALRPQLDTCAVLLLTRPWRCLFTGLAVFAAAPVLAALLFATGIGALLGMVILIAYALVLVSGGLYGVVMAARVGLARFSQGPKLSLWLAWSAIAIVAIVIGALYVVPPAGVLVATVLTFFGVGALSLDSWRRLRA